MELYSGAREFTTAKVYPRTPGQHAELLHPLKAEGQVGVARILPEPTGWKEDNWQPYELENVLAGVEGQTDTYLSQNRFTKKRRLVQDVLELCAIYSDLDYYNAPELAGLPAEAALEMAVERLQEASIPMPSLGISSGRGLQLTWRHHPVSRKELPRWNESQRRLFQVLKKLEPDAVTLHAAQVLRLAGTTNSKNGAEVRTLYNSGVVYDFEDLAEALPPVEPEQEDAEVYDLRVQRAARGGFKGPRGWNEETLWEGRLTDLQALRRLRFGRQQMGDFKDRWLFIAGVAMSWLVDSYAVLERELMGLAEEIGWTNRRKARQKMNQVFERVVMAARGETVEFNGSQWDPRYHYHNETIIKRLEITPVEEREMNTIIGPEEYNRRKKTRDREYQHRKRRAHGVPTRNQYNEQRRAEARKKAALARELKAAEPDLTAGEIAAKMGASVSSVRGWLK